MKVEFNEVSYMDIFFKIIETIAYILFGLLGIAYTYMDKVSPKWVRVFACICAVYLVVAGPIMLWGFN